MNILKETNNIPSPTLPNSNNNSSDMDLENSIPSVKSEKANKTPLKKEELEKIAKELKKKLSKASIAAKQQHQSQSSPNKINKSQINSSPLKEYVSKKDFESPSKLNYLLSSSPLYSPNNKSPTHMRTSAAASLLSSSPLLDSPIKKSKTSSPLKHQPTIVLQAVEETPSKMLSLKPSPPLSSLKNKSNGSQSQQQTTPTLPKKQLSVNTNASTNPLLRTPTQPSSQKENGNYNDNEGADLLMYLATSPSPAKSNFSNTPKFNIKPPKPTQNSENVSGPNSNGTFSVHKHTSSNSSANSFIAPPPPLTPKRHPNSAMNSKTPQNRLTPSVNLFNGANNGSLGLPSSGLALTPAGFNMNDYVNFFSPSPGGANLGKNFLKTPDFNNLLANSQGGQQQSKVVDGKMINFDKVGLFKNTESKD